MTVVPDLPAKPQIADASNEQLGRANDESTQECPQREAEGEQSLVDAIEGIEADAAAQSHGPMGVAPKGDLKTVIEHASRQQQVKNLGKPLRGGFWKGLVHV